MGFNGLVLRLTAVAAAAETVAAKTSRATTTVTSALSAQEQAIRDFQESSVVGFLIDYYKQIVALGTGKNGLDLAKLEDIIRRFGGNKIDFNYLRNPSAPGVRKTTTSTSTGTTSTSISTAVVQGKMGW